MTEAHDEQVQEIADRLAKKHATLLERLTDDLSLADRLRVEAERARTSPGGKHPEIDVMTHAAALHFAADLLERHRHDWKALRSIPPSWRCACGETTTERP